MACTTDGQDSSRETGVQRAMTFWRKQVLEWYPDILMRTYFVPPVHTDEIQHQEEKMARETVHETQLPPSSFFRDAAPVTLQESDARDEATQERVSRCLQGLAANRNEVMFVISHLSYADYLSHPAYASAASALPRPVDLKYQNKHRGDFDVLILHRHHGILVGEIKTVGEKLSSLTQQERDSKIADRLRQAIKQLQKAEYILRHLVSDQHNPPRIRKTVMLPNVTRAHLQAVLTDVRDLSQDLCQCLGVATPADPSHVCLTSDDLENPDEWWQRWVAEDDPDTAMTDSVFLDLVSRFCGPATTEAVSTSSYPRRPASARYRHRHMPGKGVKEEARRWPPFGDILIDHSSVCHSHVPGTHPWPDSVDFNSRTWLRNKIALKRSHGTDVNPTEPPRPYLTPRNVLRTNDRTESLRTPPSVPRLFQPTVCVRQTSCVHCRTASSSLLLRNVLGPWIAPFAGQGYDAVAKVPHDCVLCCDCMDRGLRELHLGRAETRRPVSSPQAHHYKDVFGLARHDADIHDTQKDLRGNVTWSSTHPKHRLPAYLSAGGRATSRCLGCGSLQASSEVQERLVYRPCCGRHEILAPGETSVVPATLGSEGQTR